MLQGVKGESGSSVLWQILLPIGLMSLLMSIFLAYYIGTHPQISEDSSLATHLTIMTVGMFLVIMVFLGWSFKRQVLYPLKQLYDLSQSIAQGNLNNRA
jgi:methyl-accepting chemotaxis protein